MKFSIGDRVLIKRTGEEGTLLSFINKQMVEVEVAGIDFPVHLDELDHPYLTWFTAAPLAGKKKQAEPPVEKAPPPRPPQGLHLSFLPVYKTVVGEDVVEHFKIHLLNELPYAVRFHYEAREVNRSLFTLQGELQPFANLLLHSLDFETMSAAPRFLWMALPVEGGKLGPHRNGEMRIRPPKLFAHLQKAIEEGEPTFRIVLLDDFIAPEKEPLLQGKLTRTPIPSSVPEKQKEEAYQVPAIIDLHLSALLGDGETLERSQALALQLRVLRYALEEAIAMKNSKLTVIHGVGRGVLRNAVHEVLRKTAEVERFSDNWHPRYGFGATEVWFAYPQDVA